MPKVTQKEFYDKLVQMQATQLVITLTEMLKDDLRFTAMQADGVELGHAEFPNCNVNNATYFLEEPL